MASPTWFRFDNGLPHVMIWDMVIDRGATTLAVFTRSRGAYAWPLSGQVPTAVSTSSFAARPAGRSVRLSWRTAAEFDVLGFNVWRVAPGKAAKVNPRLGAGQGSRSTDRRCVQRARPLGAAELLVHLPPAGRQA